MGAMLTRWARAWRVAGRPHRTVWETLHEPRRTSFLIAGFYVLMLATGIGVLLADHGQLPVGTWSARMFSAFALVLGGTIGAPTAWKGIWKAELYATLWVGIAAVLRILTVVVFNTAMLRPEVIFEVAAWAGVIVAMWLRWSRIGVSPFRAGAGPIPGHLQADMAMDRMRVEDGGNFDSGGKQCG